MKHIKILICVLLCLVSFSGCTKADNTNYFKSHLQNCPEEMRYMPAMFKKYESKDEIKISVLADNTVTYSLNNEVIADSGYKYQAINLHFKKHSNGINSTIDSIVDLFSAEKDSAVKAVKYDSNSKKYAITYEIRPDLGYTVLNVIFPASENISAYFTLRLMDTPKTIDDTILEKICNDLNVVKL